MITLTDKEKEYLSKIVGWEVTVTTSEMKNEFNDWLKKMNECGEPFSIFYIKHESEKIC